MTLVDATRKKMVKKSTYDEINVNRKVKEIKSKREIPMRLLETK